MDARQVVKIALRLILGGVFLYAGVPKIMDPVGFAANVATYRVLPYFAVYAVAAVLPWLETVCGALLIAGIRVRAAATLVILLDIVFMVLLVSAIARGLDIDCGCFLRSERTTSPWLALARDLLIFGLATFVVKQANRSHSEGNAPPCP